MSCLSKRPNSMQLIALFAAAMSLTGCDQQTNKLNSGGAAASGDQRLQPVGGLQGNADDETAAVPGGARLADEDMVTDPTDQPVVVADSGSRTHLEAPPQAQPRPDLSVAQTKQPPSGATPRVADASPPKPKSKAKSSTPATKGQRIYVVQHGDSLWKIARKQYGDGRAWRRIYDANRTKIADPSDVPIGTKLVIP